MENIDWPDVWRRDCLMQAGPFEQKRGSIHAALTFLDW
jgi:hypothetical protein